MVSNVYFGSWEYIFISHQNVCIIIATDGFQNRSLDLAATVRKVP